MCLFLTSFSVGLISKSIKYSRTNVDEQTVLAGCMDGQVPKSVHLLPLHLIAAIMYNDWLANHTRFLKIENC